MADSIIGFIGLGAMGAPMTRRLAAAYPGRVRCFDRGRDGDFSPLFQLKFMLKDTRLAGAMVPEAASRFPALAMVIATLEESVAAGHGDADFSATMKVIEARVGGRVARGS